jgi:hypothetical protein
MDMGLALAANAWLNFCRSAGRKATAPVAVTSLRSQRPSRKASVYLLEHAAEDGSAVVAKRCHRTTARVERTVYERILPNVRVSKLRYHGYYEEAEGDFGWLFLENAGRKKLLAWEGELAAAWVARLHVEAARLVEQAALPERGPAHYREHLCAVRASIAAILADHSPAKTDTQTQGEADADRSMLRRLQELLDKIDSRWQTICAPCASAPRTLVHGDFGWKNLRTRTSALGTELVALDWETAGWGPIAVDLPQLHARVGKPRADKPPRWLGTVPLEVYAAHADGAWDGSKRQDLAWIAATGTIFRYVTSIRWAGDQVQSGGTSKPMARLYQYADELPHAIAAFDGGAKLNGNGL